MADTPINRDVTLLASDARTASINTEDQENYEGRGVHVTIDVTIDPAAASVVPTIQGRDPASGAYYDLLVGLALDAVAQRELVVHPDLPAVGNLVAQDALPFIWRVRLVAADGASLTYSVGATVLL